MLDFNPRTYHRLRLPPSEAPYAPISYRQALFPPPTLPVGGWHGARKRTLDLVVAAGALVLLALPMLVLALLVRLDSPGPALFRQTRTGLDGRTFRMLKFRTMHHAAAEPDRCRQARRNDPRITRLGGGCGAPPATSCRNCSTCCVARCRSLAPARTPPAPAPGNGCSRM